MTTAVKPPMTHDAMQKAMQSADENPNRVELPVSGAVPEWLSGTLLRNGPGRWEFGDLEVNHWFDGMAMLHSFELGEGRVMYMNRFVRSKAYRSLTEDGKLAFSEFASDPCRTRFQRIQSVFKPNITDNPNVNAFKFGENFIALSETPMAIEIDPDTLETLGVAYENPDTFATAHPHLDPATGEMINMSSKIGASSWHGFFRVDPDSYAQQRIGGKLKRRMVSYQHSFGMSERWLILTEFPFVVDPIDIVRTGRPFVENFNFRPARETKITIIDRQTGEVGGEWTARAGFCFHHVNAWEEGDDVVFDLCRFDDASIVEQLSREQLRSRDYITTGYLHRYRLRPRHARAEEQRVSDAPFELPRINYKRFSGKPYRYMYAAGSSDTAALDQIIKIDAHTGEHQAWSEGDVFVGEPVFVERPGAASEDDGVLLTIVLDGEKGRSMMLVLDARDLSELARAEVSHHIPAGFHGNYFSS